MAFFCLFTFQLTTNAQASIADISKMNIKVKGTKQLSELKTMFGTYGCSSDDEKMIIVTLEGMCSTSFNPLYLKADNFSIVYKEDGVYKNHVGQAVNFGSFWISSDWAITSSDGMDIDAGVFEFEVAFCVPEDLNSFKFMIPKLLSENTAIRWD